MSNKTQRRIPKRSSRMGQRQKIPVQDVSTYFENKGLYSVKVQLKEGRKYRTIWLFHAIVAHDKEDAIRNCKYEMERILGTIRENYKWVAESEWENNPNVN